MHNNINNKINLNCWKIEKNYQQWFDNFFALLTTKLGNYLPSLLTTTNKNSRRPSENSWKRLCKFFAKLGFWQKICTMKYDVTFSCHIKHCALQEVVKIVIFA